MNKSIQTFIGSLFGDGNIFLNKEKCLSYSEIHSLKQKDYLLWKMRLMSKLFNFAGSPYMFDTYDKRTKKIYSHIKINASNTIKLRQYYDAFYKNKIKIVPTKFLYKLNELGLAIWYQDDGTYNYGGYRCSIATDNLNYKQHLLIKRFLKEKYNIICEIYKKGKQFYTAFNRKESEKFLKLVKPHIHKSMVYKLGHLDNSNNEKVVEGNNKSKERSRKYSELHREELTNYQKEYRKNNLEKVKQNSRDYYLKNKEKRKAYNKEYFIKNRERVLEKNKRYKNKNKEEINKKRRLKDSGN